MARSLWTGSISFGLVNVPVRLVSAVRDVDVHFRQLHRPDGAPIDIRRFCSEEEREVDYSEIGHGYELQDGRQVVLTDEDLESVAPRKTRTIDIEAFVDLAEVDPVLFDHPYLLQPSGESEGTRRAYQLLVEVLGRSERAALGRFVLRAKEYLALMRVRDGRLALTTLHFHDEIRSREGIADGDAKPSRQQHENAVALIEQLSVEWNPEDYEDRYRQRLLAVIEERKQGRRVVVPQQEKQPAAVPDLMAALERSLEEARRGAFRAPEAMRSEDDQQDVASPATGPRSEGDAREGDGDDRARLRKLSRAELYERAQERDIAGRASMRKDELIDALAG